MSGSAEAADHDGGAVRHIRQGGRRAWNELEIIGVCERGGV
ncbi:hypothetical protein D555_1078 [Bordetella holmesii 35009]|nr:hypothetical protein D555_1078 [Bordetella holmesii 35009]